MFDILDFTKKELAQNEKPDYFCSTCNKEGPHKKGKCLVATRCQWCIKCNPNNRFTDHKFESCSSLKLKLASQVEKLESQKTTTVPHPDVYYDLLWKTIEQAQLNNFQGLEIWLKHRGLEVYSSNSMHAAVQSTNYLNQFDWIKYFNKHF